jgi:hypothetical protein
MSEYVYEVPTPDDDLCIVIGDTYPGALLTLSVSPGVGTYFASLQAEFNRGLRLPFDVTVNSPTELVISMTDPTTRRLTVGRYQWSLLFRETATGNDRTICRGYANAVEYPTSTV